VHEFAPRWVRTDQTTDPDSHALRETGLSLVELMVVLLIVAVLLAIAIPTFLGATGTANDRAAQSDLSNGLTEASAAYQANNQSYSGISAALVSSAPEFSWVSPRRRLHRGSTQIGVYSVDVAASGDAQGVILADLSKTGTCWWVAQLGAAPRVVPGTGFETSATAGDAGYESGVASAGSYYAEQTNPGNDCYAKYPETDSAGFNWGTTYSNPGVN
jgi:type IV pilus assembly protein PilA